jgi:hypothetical protein
MGDHRGMKTWQIDPLSSCDAQAACGFETTNLLRFFRTLQLSVQVAILRTVAGLNAQPTIGPELPFAAEPVRRLHQRD